MYIFQKFHSYLGNIRFTVGLKFSIFFAMALTPTVYAILRHTVYMELLALKVSCQTQEKEEAIFLDLLH